MCKDTFAASASTPCSLSLVRSRSLSLPTANFGSLTHQNGSIFLPHMADLTSPAPTTTAAASGAALPGTSTQVASPSCAGCGSPPSAPDAACAVCLKTASSYDRSLCGLQQSTVFSFDGRACDAALHPPPPHVYIRVDGPTLPRTRGWLVVCNGCQLARMHGWKDRRSNQVSASKLQLALTVPCSCMLYRRERRCTRADHDSV